jgi:hypothetical protein
MKQKIEELISNVESYKSSIFAKEDVIEMLKDLIDDNSITTIFEQEQQNDTTLDLSDFKEKLESFLIEKMSEIEFVDFVKNDQCDYKIENYNQVVLERLSIDVESLTRLALDDFEKEFEVS